MQPIIGIDLDNTIVCYDTLVHDIAVERGLIGPSFPRNKKAIRDHVRTKPDGEMSWQRLQAVMYGTAMERAEAYDGVLCFITRCRERGIRVVIVSHKTKHASASKENIDLREAARLWLRKNGFFSAPALLSEEHDVHFEQTRSDKIRRIGSIGCTHFIDDLEELFLEPSFPPGVKKILFAPHGEGSESPDIVTVSQWTRIEDVVFGNDKATS